MRDDSVKVTYRGVELRSDGNGRWSFDDGHGTIGIHEMTEDAIGMINAAAEQRLEHCGLAAVLDADDYLCCEHDGAKVILECGDLAKRDNLMRKYMELLRDPSAVVISKNFLGALAGDGASPNVRVGRSQAPKKKQRLPRAQVRSAQHKQAADANNPKRSRRAV